MYSGVEPFLCIERIIMVFNRMQLIVHWYRTETDQQGDVITEFAQLTLDGQYEFCFTYHSALGELTEQSIELGEWGLVGDIHFTIAKSDVLSDGEFLCDLCDESNYHAYQVIELSEQIFKYRHIVSNEVFILKRVVDKIAHC